MLKCSSFLGAGSRPSPREVLGRAIVVLTIFAARRAIGNMKPSRALFRAQPLLARTRPFSSDRGGAIVTGANGLKLYLPPAEDPVGPYRKAIYCPVSQMLFTSTHVGTDEGNAIVRGRVGEGEGLIAPERAKVLARHAGLRLLATLHSVLDGDLSRVSQVLKLTGLVNGVPEFKAYGTVIDGCSEVLIEAFGDEVGVGARVCCGAGLGGAVSCDLVVRARPA